jgi:hypothetical protein
MKEYQKTYKENEEEFNLYLIKEALKDKHISNKKLVEGIKKIFHISKNKDLDNILWQGNGYEKEWFKKALVKIKKNYHKELGKKKINFSTIMNKKLREDINYFIEDNMYSTSADIIEAYEKKHGIEL